MVALWFHPIHRPNLFFQVPVDLYMLLANGTKAGFLCLKELFFLKSLSQPSLCSLDVACVGPRQHIQVYKHGLHSTPS